MQSTCYQITQKRTTPMKSLFLTLIITLTFIFSSFGQQCDSCKMDFDKLLRIKKKAKVTQIDLERCWQITKKLYTLRYVDYIDKVVNNESFVSHSLTRTYSELCDKAGGEIGVDYYFKYLTFTNGSAEEERSFALERLFVKYPMVVLNRIGKNIELLDLLTWGYLNNRYYGTKNPFENEDYTAMTIYKTTPKPVLNKDNCKKIFFETNPSLKEKYTKYKFQIDYIINTAIKSLKERK